MYDVFISYVHGQPIAHAMETALKSRGLIPFIDTQLSIGTPLVSALNHALREAKSYLLIIDKSFVKSDWANAESQTAFLQALKSKRLFPLVIDDEAKKFWFEDNPLYSNYLARVWSESTPEILAEEIHSVLKTLTI